MWGFRGGGGGGGGRGSGPPEKIPKYRGFSHSCLDPLKKSQKYQASIQCWAIISTSAKRHLNGVLLAGRWWPAYSGIWIIPPIIYLKKPCQSWSPSDKIFWIRACLLLKNVRIVGITTHTARLYVYLTLTFDSQVHIGNQKHLLSSTHHMQLLCQICTSSIEQCKRSWRYKVCKAAKTRN